MRKIYVVPADVPDWYYVFGHEGPGCYRACDLQAMGYWLHEQPLGRSQIIIPGYGVWYVGRSSEYPYTGVVFSVDDPGLFPNFMAPTEDGETYYPPRGLLAPNSLQAATDWIGLNQMDWPARIICSQSNGAILTVTYHHWGEDQYRRKRRRR